MRMLRRIFSCLVLGLHTAALGSTIPVDTLIGEAACEGYAGMRAVGEVIRNRAAKSGRSVDQVCQAHNAKGIHAFSFWNNRLLAANFLAANKRSRITAERAWKDSETSTTTYGATHFESVDFKKPSWAGKAKTRVGKHVFY